MAPWLLRGRAPVAETATRAHEAAVSASLWNLHGPHLESPPSIHWSASGIRHVCRDRCTHLGRLPLGQAQGAVLACCH